MVIWGFIAGGWAALGKPAPLQLVLRLAKPKGGDREDDETFDTLHRRFKQQFSMPCSMRFEALTRMGVSFGSSSPGQTRAPFAKQWWQS